MGYKRYSDQQKAAALAALKANSGNFFRTAKELHIPLTSLVNWAKDTREPVDGFPKLVTEKEEELATLCEKVARKYLNQAADPFVVAATPGHLAAIAAGVAIDKSRLLNEKPTSIVGSQDSKQTILAEIQTKFGLTHEKASAIISDVFGDELASDSVS